MTIEAGSIEDIENHRKRLIYRSWHRGTREMDLILGRFAEKYVVNFSASELAQYEQLLQYEDPDLYNWLIGVVTPPANIPLQIIDQIKETINY